MTNTIQKDIDSIKRLIEEVNNTPHKDNMKSIKQNEQIYGYAKHAIIKTILSHYKTKLEDLSIEDLEEELYAEEETTKFGEVPFRSNYDGSSLLSMGLEQYQDSEHEVTPRPSDEEIKIAAEKLVEQARLEGFIITPKVSASDQRKVSKWQMHQEYSKKKVRETPRHKSENEVFQQEYELRGGQ